MEATDWKQDKLGNYVYDASLTKVNAATKLTEGETYLGESSSINVLDKNSGETSKINLNSDESVSGFVNGEPAIYENTTINFGFESGHKVMAGNHGKGTYYEINFNWAFGGGFGGALGYVTDSGGKSSLYFTLNGNAGLGFGGGFDYGGITPTIVGHQFTLKDFEGEGSSYSLSTPFLSVSFGVSYDTKTSGIGLNKLDPNNFGKTTLLNGYTTQSFGVGIGPSTKAGAMYSSGKTWLIK